MGNWKPIRADRLLLVVLVLALALLASASPGLAAGSGTDTIANAGTGLGGTFDTNLKTIAKGIVSAMHVILIVMTAVAGMMIAFGIEDGKKFIWQAMLGFGLAFNFGAFLIGTDLWTAGSAAMPPSPTTRPSSRIPPRTSASWAAS